MCLIDNVTGRDCCFGCRMDILLCGLNFLITIGCGTTTVALSIIRLKDLKSSGARIANASHVKPTIASSGISGPGSCMSQLDDFSDKAFIGQIYTLSLYIFYALLDLLAACLIAFIYRNSDFLLDTTSRQVETTKRQKQRRYFHYWVALQFLLTLALIFHAAFILATEDVNPAIGALIVLFICWKLFYFAIFAKKLVHLELNERDNHTRKEDHERSVKKSKESAMTGRWVSQELRNSRANLNVNSERELDAKSKSKGKGTRTGKGTSDEVEGQNEPSPSSSSSSPPVQISAQANTDTDLQDQDVAMTNENANRATGNHDKNIDQQEQPRKISNSPVSAPVPVPVNTLKIITAQDTGAHQSAQKPQVVTVKVTIEDEKLPVPVLESLTQTVPAEAPAAVAKVETEELLSGDEAQKDTILNNAGVAALPIATKTENAAIETVTEIGTRTPELRRQQETEETSVPENNFKIPAPQLNTVGESDLSLSLSSENTDEMPAAETEINEKQNIEELEKFIGTLELQNDPDDTETEVHALPLDTGATTEVPVPVPAPAVETHVILSDIILPPSGFQTINDLPAPISA